MRSARLYGDDSDPAKFSAAWEDLSPMGTARLAALHKSILSNFSPGPFCSFPHPATAIMAWSHPGLLSRHLLEEPSPDPSEQGCIDPEMLLWLQISAKKGTGIDELLETVLLVAEVEQLTANPLRMARGTVVEAAMDRRKGPAATIIVSTGTLKVGDIVHAGATFGKVSENLLRLFQTSTVAPDALPCNTWCSSALRLLLCSCPLILQISPKLYALTAIPRSKMSHPSSQQTGQQIQDNMSKPLVVA